MGHELEFLKLEIANLREDAAVALHQGHVSFHAERVEDGIGIRRWLPFDVRYDLEDEKWKMRLDGAQVYVNGVGINSQAASPAGWTEVGVGTYYLQITIPLNLDLANANWNVGTGETGTVNLAICDIASSSSTQYLHGAVSLEIGPEDLYGETPVEKIVLAGSGISADENSWSWASDGDKRPVLQMFVRAAYLDDPAYMNYAFSRQVSFGDACRIESVAEEARTEIVSATEENP